MGSGHPRIISVGGGKGGVGKSVVAANLATAMAHAGLRVVLVDADLGAANQHTLFGIHRPGPTLHALFQHDITSLEEALVPTCVRGLQLLPGSSAVLGAANINHGQKQRLMRHIQGMDAEAVVIDVGAGSSFNTLDLFDIADFKLVVVTPQFTSMQNAYAFLKGAVLRALRPLMVAEPGLEAIFEAAGKGETTRIQTLLKTVAQSYPEVAVALRQRLDGFRARLIANLVFAPREAAAVAALSRMIADFLCLRVPLLGHIASERAIHASVDQGRPFVLNGVPDNASRLISEIAEELILEPVEPRSVEAAPSSTDREAGPMSSRSAESHTQAA
jgi:flagellar biosynthesis protein FlhG